MVGHVINAEMDTPHNAICINSTSWNAYDIDTKVYVGTAYIYNEENNTHEITQRNAFLTILSVYYFVYLLLFRSRAVLSNHNCMVSFIGLKCDLLFGFNLLILQLGHLTGKHSLRFSSWVDAVSLDGYDHKDSMVIAKRSRDYAGLVTKACKRVSKRIGFDGYFTFYSARHSSATVALNRGVDKRTVSYLLDHADLSTVDNYAGQANDDNVVSAMELIRI